jgi:hypothetical protein
MLQPHSAPCNTQHTVQEASANISSTKHGTTPRCLTPATSRVSSSRKTSGTAIASPHHPKNSPASLPLDRTTTNGDTAQKRSPIEPEGCTPHLAICIETLAAYLQSMSRSQVSHSSLILTCDETRGGSTTMLAHGRRDPDPFPFPHEIGYRTNKTNQNLPVLVTYLPHRLETGSFGREAVSSSPYYDHCGP